MVTRLIRVASLLLIAAAATSWADNPMVAATERSWSAGVPNSRPSSGCRCWCRRSPARGRTGRSTPTRSIVTASRTRSRASSKMSPPSSTTTRCSALPASAGRPAVWAPPQLRRRPPPRCRRRFTGGTDLQWTGRPSMRTHRLRDPRRSSMSAAIRGTPFSRPHPEPSRALRADNARNDNGWPARSRYRYRNRNRYRCALGQSR